MQPNSFPWQSPLPCSSSLPATCTTGQSKVAAWLQDSEEMDRCAEGQFMPSVGSQGEPTGQTRKGQILWVLQLSGFLPVHSPAPSELLNLVSPLRWLPPTSTLSPHFLASLASHTLDSGGDHPAECFLGSTLHPLSWQSTRSLTRPPSLLLCLAHRTVYVPQLLAINSHVILHLIATVAWCGVPLWISHWRLWTSTQFLHYTISQPLDLQKLFPSMSWTWACWFKLDPQTISSLWDGFHLTFKNEKKKKIIITGI